MSALFFPSLNGAFHAGAVNAPAARGVFINNNFYPRTRQRLATDAVGTSKIAISGIKPGSEIHLISATSEVIASNESASGLAQFEVPRYSAGSAGNTIRVFIIALGFEVIDFPYTLTPSEVSIPIFQRVDRSYRNPT